MRFEVRAMRAQELVSLHVEAPDADAARAQALAASLTPISVRARGQGQARASGPSGFSVLLFSQELVSLLQAGLSIVEAIDTLLEKEGGTQAATVLTRVRASLGTGMRFSAALEAAGDTFPPLYVGLLRAAERTSDLKTCLARYVEFETRLAGVRERVVGATLYPAILLAVGLIVTLFLSLYVVPRFAGVYQGSGRELPAASAALLAWGSFASAHALPLLVGLAAGLAALVAWTRGRVARGGWSSLIERVPGVASRIRVYQLSRLYLTLGMLIDGGMPVLAALKLSRAAVGASLAQRLDAAAQDIHNGTALAAAFERHGLATTVALRFLRVGEGAGNLGEMLGRSSAYHDAEIARWIATFARVFEPLLMAAIGAVVGLIVVLLYLPIFDLAGSLG
ncbi:MAG: type II secretion system F family protein [Burkholderiales bacterium]